MQVEAERVQILLAHHVVQVQPVPGTTTPEPSPFVQVALQRRPSASITEMCVVSPKAHREEALEKPLVAEALEEVRRALGLRCAHRLEHPVQRRRRRAAVEQGERVGEQRSPGGGRRVGQHLAIAVGHPSRLALDRPISGEIARRKRASARAQPVAHRRRDLALIEGARALLAEQVQRIAQLAVAQHLALAQDASAGRPQGRALRRGGQ